MMTYNATSPSATATIHAFHAGQRLIWKEINLRHHSDSFTFIEQTGDTLRVKFHSGRTGEVLARHAMPWEPRMA